MVDHHRHVEIHLSLIKLIFVIPGSLQLLHNTHNHLSRNDHFFDQILGQYLLLGEMPKKSIQEIIFFFPFIGVI